jgi:hypothetical protein
MNRGAIILLLVLLGANCPAVDQLLRERSVRPATSNYTTLGRIDLPFVAVYADGFYDHGVRLTNGGSGSSFTQTNIDYHAVTNAPWQIGSQNSTNWSALPTNTLFNYVTTNRVVTNTAWVQTISYTNTVYVPNALFDTNGTLFSWTADGGQYRIDTMRLLTTPVLGQVNNYEHDIGIFWTNTVGERLDFLLSNNYSDGRTASSANNNEYLTVATFLVRAPAGKLVTVTNHAVITTANGVGGTNHISMEVSHPVALYTLTSP